MRIRSSDGVNVAVHEFGGSGRPLLLAHATGFNGHCYLPIADELADEVTAFALDFRGHGDTARPDDWQVDWDRYGDDVLAASRAIAPHGGLIAFGHSMGGACLLMAAHRHPGLFDMIVAFEPIVFPPPGPGTPATANPGPVLAAGARRRREWFESFDEAIAHYSLKPPMNAFDPDVVRQYVAHGFRPAPQGVRLKCDPEHEARTFDAGADHATWASLPEIETPTVILAGTTDTPGPAAIAHAVAEQLPNAAYVQRDEWNHFTPFIDPAAIAHAIRDAW